MSLKERPLREDLVLQACLEAYGSVRHEGRLSDRALEHVLRHARHLYSNERRAVAERVYALLRRQRLVDFLAERGIKKFTDLPTTTQDRWRIGISRVLEGDNPSDVARANGLTGEEAKTLRALPLDALNSLKPEARFAVEHSLPDFFAVRLMQELGDEAKAAAEAMNVRGPLTVRINALKATRDEVRTMLEAEKVTVTPTPLSPFGLMLETRTNVFSLKAFKEGFFEIQDEGSQLLGMLVDAPPRKVVDACAGAGGKSLQLAAQMKNRGELFALDVDERRLEDLRLRARRAGCHNIRVQAIPAGEEALEATKALHGQCERVLVDAPCSGSGTFRRKPDARYRLDEASLADHVSRQKTLLGRFSVMVKPGGRLIYGTCSVLRAENEEVVQHFLESHPDFSIAPAATWLGAELAENTTRNGLLRLYPHRHGTDGFFGAVLVRAKS